MVQAAESWHGYDLSALGGILFCFPTGRPSLCQRKMSAFLVVIANVLFHKAFQMALVEHDHMVEKVTSAVADPTPRNSVLPRTSEAGSLGLDTKLFTASASPVIWRLSHASHPDFASRRREKSSKIVLQRRRSPSSRATDPIAPRQILNGNDCKCRKSLYIYENGKVRYLSAKTRSYSKKPGCVTPTAQY